MGALNDYELQQFKVFVRDQIRAAGIHRVETAVLKDGARVRKTASLLYCGRSADEITKIELRLKSWTRNAIGEYVEDKGWACEKNEIQALRVLLEAELKEAGGYRLLLRPSNATETVIEYIVNGELPSGFLAAVAKGVAARIANTSDLSEFDGVEFVGRAAEVRRRAAVAEEFRRVVADPASKESAFQSLLEANGWLLGSQYVETLDRRQLVMLDEYDLAMMRADGVLHLVELKKANVANLVRPHRAHHRVGDAVNEAVAQAANYLRAIDEQRAQILVQFKVECRRAQATVIIGHPDHNGRDDTTAEDVREAIRTYNSHLSRIEVLTYEDILRTAQNSIDALSAHSEL